MANATYLLGSNPYVRVELEEADLSTDFVAASWTYSLVLKALSTTFSAATEDGWVAATYELMTDDQGQTHHVVKALLTDLVTAAGQYNPYVRLVNAAAETETPQYLDAAGIVTVK